MIERAIFVLTCPEAGQQFLRVLPDLKEIGLSEATVLHLVSARRGPAEPMPGLANWVRHFEAAVPRVELALKRGDPVKWIYELARVRDVHIVVLSGAPNGVEWDFERVTSPLRTLGIPILYLPPVQVEASLSDRVLVAVKAPDRFARIESRLRDWFGAAHLRAVHVAGPDAEPESLERSGMVLDIVPDRDGVASTLLECATECEATLMTILAYEEAGVNHGQQGVPVVKPLVEAADRPLLIWPAETAPLR